MRVIGHDASVKTKVLVTGAALTRGAGASLAASVVSDTVQRTFQNIYKGGGQASRVPIDLHACHFQI